MINYAGEKDTFYICLFKDESGKYKYISDWFTFSESAETVILFLDTCLTLLKYPVNTSVNYNIDGHSIKIINKMSYLIIVYEKGYFTLNCRNLKMMKSVVQK